LSLPQKLKLLSQIAIITFEQSDYFFAQSKVQQYIADRTLSTAQTTAEVLQLNSEAVLKSIEQHGLLVERGREIYSFSHPFKSTSAKTLLLTRSTVLGQNLAQLIDDGWREVLLLTAGMLEMPLISLQLMPATRQ